MGRWDEKELLLLSENYHSLCEVNGEVGKPLVKSSVNPMLALVPNNSQAAVSAEDVSKVFQSPCRPTLHTLATH